MRSRFFVALFLAALGLAIAHPAQAYLTQPIKVVVPTGPGSIADTVTRLIAQGPSIQGLVKVTGQKPLQERVAEFGAELRGGSPADLGAFTQQQSAMYERIIKEAGIKPE